MENENIIENNSLSSTADSISDSAEDNVKPETENITADESAEGQAETSNETGQENGSDLIIEEAPSGEEGWVDDPFTETTTSASDYTEAFSEANTTLHHIDSVAQYGASILIVLLVIVLLNYVYKFFKMFF